MTPQSLTCHAWLMSKIKHVIPQQVVSPPPTIPTHLVGTVIPVPPKRHLQPDNLTTARRFSRLDISTTTCQSILETSSYYSYLIVASPSSSFLFESVTASVFPCPRFFFFSVPFRQHLSESEIFYIHGSNIFSFLQSVRLSFPWLLVLVPLGVQGHIERLIVSPSGSTLPTFLTNIILVSDLVPPSPA